MRPMTRRAGVVEGRGVCRTPAAEGWSVGAKAHTQAGIQSVATIDGRTTFSTSTTTPAAQRPDTFSFFRSILTDRKHGRSSGRCYVRFPTASKNAPEHVLTVFRSSKRRKFVAGMILPY